MRIISLLLKYGYWRDALRKVFYDVLGQWSGREVVSLRTRAEFCLEVLRKLCVAMSGVVSQPWIDNVGYTIGFCGGLVPWWWCPLWCPFWVEGNATFGKFVTLVVVMWL